MKKLRFLSVISSVLLFLGVLPVSYEKAYSAGSDYNWYTVGTNESGEVTVPEVDDGKSNELNNTQKAPQIFLWSFLAFCHHIWYNVCNLTLHFYLIAAADTQIGGNNMKRLIVCASTALVLTGCNFRPKIPDDWYKETLQYYSEGFAGGWKNERSDLYVSDEMKDEKNKFGYLLKDLDGDGADELLIGYMDDAAETRFTDIFIYHSDYGAFRIIHAGDGYYLYLCEDNIVREDSWYGSATKTSYMKYLPENNSFLILDREAAPQKFTLTAF